MEVISHDFFQKHLLSLVWGDWVLLCLSETALNFSSCLVLSKKLEKD
jgi:hypothetical protein